MLLTELNNMFDRVARTRGSTVRHATGARTAGVVRGSSRRTSRLDAVHPAAVLSRQRVARRARHGHNVAGAAGSGSNRGRRYQIGFKFSRPEPEMLGRVDSAGVGSGRGYCEVIIRTTRLIARRLLQLLGWSKKALGRKIGRSNVKS